MRYKPVLILLALIIVLPTSLIASGCGSKKKRKNYIVGTGQNTTPPPPTPLPPPADPVSRGVLVGIADYPDSSMDLYYCDDDARVLGETLLADSNRWNLDYGTLLLNSDATRANIEAAIKAMVQASRPDDVVMFFYSGHGSTQDDTNGDESDGLDETLCFYDGDVTDDTLTSWFQGIQSQNIIILIDACFAGGIAKSASEETTDFYKKTRKNKCRPGAGKPSKGDGIASDFKKKYSKDMDSFPDCIILTSSAADETSQESPSLEHGVFAYYLIESLRMAPADYNSSGMLSVEEAFRWLEPRVISRNPDQHPQIFDNFTGELDFIIAGTEVPPPPPPDDSFEHNDTMETASDFTSKKGIWTENLYAVECDLDFYSVNLSSTSIQVDVNFTHAGGDIDIILLDSLGDEVANSCTISDNEQIIQNGLTPGTYYICVFLFSGISNQYDLMWQ